MVWWSSAECALNLVDVELNARGVVRNRISIADDEVVIRQESLQEASLSAAMHDLRARVRLCRMPHTAFEMVEREGCEASLVESRGVALDIELVKIAQHRETNLGVFVDALPQ